MKKAATTTAQAASTAASPRTLAIDIGGTGIKTIVLDANGKAITERIRRPTPHKATPAKLLAVVKDLAQQQGEFDRISAGFPGVIKDGVVYTAANLGKDWHGFNLAKALTKKLKHPARVANDADIQGMGSVSGKGLELVITLGTGFGSALFTDGHPIHLELGHHPFHKGKTYEDELGERALAKKGKKKWNVLLMEALNDLQRTFNYDRLYIGGGNTKSITAELPANVKVISNEDGLLGGIALWREPDNASGQPSPNDPSVATPQPKAFFNKLRKMEVSTTVTTT